MKVQLTHTTPASADCYVFALLPGDTPPLPQELPNGLTADTITNHSKGMDAKGVTARTFCISHEHKHMWVILASTGTHTDAFALRQWVDAVMAAGRSVNAAHMVFDLDHLSTHFTCDNNTLRLLIQRTIHASYRFDHYKHKKDTPQLPSLSINVKDDHNQHQDTLTQTLALASGQKLARDLGNLAPNDCTADYLQNQCETLVKKNRNFTLHLVDKKRMKKLGFGAFLAVGRGSAQDPRLIILEYKHPQANGKPLALLGKGLTFDSGGISLKPPGGMEEMKFDMCGAASVIGACHSIGQLQPRIHALFAVAIAENMPSHKATRPGDIVTTLSGKTVEILNTDAEGRLVLCDALTYLQQQFSPQSIVDIATLTGACVVALGHHASALYSNNDSLAQRLEAAGGVTDDKVWRMPLWREYDEQLASNLVDIPNISSGRDAGSITAACFLSRFCASVDWAHLDIAGTAWVSGKNKLATGRPAALLTQYLLQQEQ